MYNEKDAETLDKVKKFSAKQKKRFSILINSKNLSEEEMDELFLNY